MCGFWRTQTLELQRYIITSSVSADRQGSRVMLDGLEHRESQEEGEGIIVFLGAAKDRMEGLT